MVTFQSDVDGQLEQGSMFPDLVPPVKVCSWCGVALSPHALARLCSDRCRASFRKSRIAQGDRP